MITQRLTVEEETLRQMASELKEKLIHYPHETIFDFVDNIRIFSGIHKKEVSKERKKPYLFKVLIWPKLKFINNFILKLGIFDGTRGFVLSVMMSFHSFLSWGELWLITRGKKRWE